MCNRHCDPENDVGNEHGAPERSGDHSRHESKIPIEHESVEAATDDRDNKWQRENEARYPYIYIKVCSEAACHSAQHTLIRTSVQSFGDVRFYRFRWNNYPEQYVHPEQHTNEHN